MTRDDVSWCYRTLLRREPESSEIIDLHLGAPSLRSLISDFLDSAEHATVAATRSARQQLPEASYLSLGTHCFSSALLRRLGVRHWSGPFDWTFCSLPMVAHCLADDFAAFLDRSQYEPVPVDARPNGPTVNRVQHRFYHSQFGVAFVFNHHDVHLDPGYDYMVRCVDRFREALRAPTPKVFLATLRQTETSLLELQHLAAVLRQQAGRFRLVAFLIDSDTSRPLPVARPLPGGDDFCAYRFSASSPWGAVAFADSIDETCMATVFAQEAKALLVQPA